MRVAVFSTHPFEQDYLLQENDSRHELKLIPERLAPETAILAQDCTAALVFTNDQCDKKTLQNLQKLGIRFLATRSAGYNHIDREAAKELEIKVANVPEYSPASIAEHAVAMIQALNRKLIVSYDRIRNNKFNIDGLEGFELGKQTVGLIGLGNIGRETARILRGYGCDLFGHDVKTDEKLVRKFKIKHTSLEELCSQSDIISLHVPLNKDTHYILNEKLIRLMKPGVMVINTSRGAVLNTKDVIDALKKGQIGALGIDVYENEHDLFFADHSSEILQDDMFARLLSFKNVLITGHHAFLTKTALRNIAATTIYNLNCWQKRIKSKNELA